MKTIKFLRSYAKLKEFLTKTNARIGSKLNEEEKSALFSELAPFAINKYRENWKRLQSNDYLTAIIEIKSLTCRMDPQRLRQLYNLLIEVLVPTVKVDPKTIQRHKPHKDILIVESDTRWYFVFEKSINESLDRDNAENPLDYTPINGFNDNREILFEDLNKSEKVRIPLYDNGNPSREAMIASLYSILLELHDDNSNFDKTNSSQDIIQSVANNGYVVIENFVSSETLKIIRETTYRIADQQSKKGTAYFYGNEGKAQRIYNLLARDQIFWNLLLDERVENIVEEFFNRDTLHDKYFLSSYQANILHPGAEAQILHTDLAIPEPLPPWPVRLNVNLTVDDFKIENGATLVLPKSHHSLKKPNPFETDLKLTPIVAPRGSLIIWTGHLWHKSGTNQSESPRAAILACYAASYLRELCAEENYLLVNSRDVINQLPAKLRRLIGASHGAKSSA
jgi:ectoine hydroxylase-related dioxygenase (phytanoyl-CoA dioxygenase family)